MSDRVTLQSLADELGCSAKTVSNAFTRPDQLSPATRERVLRAAARRGYPGPDPLAAGLRRGRVGALGFAYANALTYAFEDPVSVELLAGIGTVAEAAGTGLLLLPGSATHQRNAAAVTGAVIDGLLVSSLADDDPLLAAALARGLPTVVIDQPYPGELARRAGAGTAGPPGWVGIDDRAGAAAIARHLTALGHRHLGVVCFGLQRDPVAGLAGPRVQAAATYAVSRERLAGYREVLAAVGVNWETVPVSAGTDSTVAEGAAGAARLLARTPRPTALLCLSDRLAEGALLAARDLGLEVPGELSIAGFDDALSAAGRGLTTVRQPTRRKGELAARALLGLLAGEPPVPAQTLATELVVRTSTAPALYS